MVSERVIHAAVVVLGDLGRSPRMLYHARSLALHGSDVDLIGYAGSELPRDIVEHPRIRCHRLQDSGSPFLRGGYLRIGLSAVRMVAQAVKLFALLFFRIGKPDLLLLQNPPGVPALALMLVCARLRAARLIVDWHNFGYTVLALKLPAASVPVRLTRWYEHTFARRADAHLCVSEAMREELEERWRLRNVSVVYDRPARKFAPARADERPLLYRSLPAVFGGNGARGEQRTALLVSATSWTPDEDFSVLLEALAMLEAKIRGGERFPTLSVVISGDGPLREYYEKRIAALPLGRISVRTAWLSAEDYPLLLRAADLGVCLHRSSSGLDLPMKLADMFGSGLPVLALNYGPCLREQLRDGENGFLFSTPAELAEKIFDLLKDFPASAPTLERLRDNIAAAAVPRWDDEWNARAWPAIARCLNESR